MRRRIAQEILPAELWELIMQDSDLAPDSLLVLAAVCRIFNQLCIARYFLRIGVPADALAAGNINIESRHISALRISCFPARIQRLSFTEFSNVGLRGNLLSVHRIIKNSPELCEINLDFADDLFGIPPTDYQQNLLRSLCDIMHTMSSRKQGPVIMLSADGLFRCDPDDIMQWQLHPKIANLRTYCRRPTWNPGHLIIRDPSGYPVKIDMIPSIRSVSLCYIPSNSEASQTFTFIIINPQSADCLRLGRSGTARSSHSMDSSELCALLLQIVLPLLLHVEIHTTTIDPTVLTQFLLRHPKVTFLAYEPPATDIRQPCLLDPPIIHPALTDIRVNDLMHLIPLLDGIGASPTLSFICFPHTRDSVTACARLTAALRRIALLPRTITLVLALPIAPRRVLDADERTVAQTLHCVAHIDVQCPSVTAARALLPWLDLLPALQRVEFRSLRGVFQWSGQAVPFLREAMARLPRVSEVVVHERAGYSTLAERPQGTVSGRRAACQLVGHIGYHLMPNQNQSGQRQELIDPGVLPRLRALHVGAIRAEMWGRATNANATRLEQRVAALETHSNASPSFPAILPTHGHPLQHLMTGDETEMEIDAPAGDADGMGVCGAEEGVCFGKWGDAAQVAADVCSGAVVCRCEMYRDYLAPVVAVSLGSRS
ncbi:hypothetical protein DFH07DRAFT_991783 [Mycena maculata]|uniref:F-box domain-containing protein n=1 Tax=Mycena maculata TaxID=230809 RepID=A0AAD7MTM1_9AGAR|nr:hypothetical protein DFH07DRAFT_991783 [Mycena maculata]